MTIQDRLKTFPISRLEAIYNHCWRNQHNDIDVKANRTMLRLIEVECTLRNIQITGRGGSYELILQVRSN